MPTPDSDGPGTGAPVGLLDDPARLLAVRRLVDGLEDTTGLDRLTRLAALLLDVPHSQVSLTGQEQVVVSAAGPGTPDLPSVSRVEDSLCTVTVATGAPLVVPDTLLDGRVSSLPPVRAGIRGYLGVPLRSATGVPLGALCVYDEEPRSWTAEHVGVLTVLAESVVAELELSALGIDAASTAARLDLALDASGIGSFDWEIDTGVLLWDDRLVRLFGYRRQDFVEHFDSFRERLHPEDVEHVLADLDRAVATGGEFSSEYRIVLPPGTGDGADGVRWIQARGRVLPARGRGGSPRLLGVAYDVTALREARDGLARTLETMNDAFYALDNQWRFTYVNRQAERLLKRSRAELLGQRLWDEFPEALDSPFQVHYEQAVATGEPVVFEAPFAPLGGWYELSAWPGPEGLSVYFREVSQRRKAEEQRERAYAEREEAVLERERAYAEAEAANTRLALLAHASDRLAASLEPRQVLERLSDLVLPELGEWVVVALSAETTALLRGQSVAADPGRVHVVHVAHADPGRREQLARAVGALPLRTSDPVGVGAVVRTGTPEWFDRVPEEVVEQLSDDPEVRTALRALDVSSALTLPLANRGHVLGAMTVASPAGGAVDRALLTDLAGRAAVALDNALLYGAERRNGITLQRSLLPQEVPAVPGLLAAARYLPGTTGAFVGGDWYQGVRVGGGLVVAMGDVMGHGMRSAARMGQLRAIVATLALEGHSPATLLRRLADSVDVLLDLELATLLVAAYDPDAGTLDVASAGHPPPLLAPLAGPPRFLEVEPGPPLGSFSYPYVQTTVALTPGDTLVLYTDGLVENRDESLDVGLERLRAALEDVRLPPEQVCDSVLAALDRADGGDDDVALLVLSHLPADA